MVRSLDMPTSAMETLAWSASRDLKVVTGKRYLDDFDVLVSNTDTLAFLGSVPDESFQLVVTSPPYNIGKPYEQRQEFKDYLEWQELVIKECVRVLKQGGSLCWEVGNYQTKSRTQTTQ